MEHRPWQGPDFKDPGLVQDLCFRSSSSEVGLATEMLAKLSWLVKKTWLLTDVIEMSELSW